MAEELLHQRFTLDVWGGLHFRRYHGVEIAPTLLTAEGKMAEQLEEVVPQVVPEQVKVERPRRARLTPEETRRRMEAFDERKEQFIASVRKGKS